MGSFVCCLVGSRARFEHARQCGTQVGNGAQRLGEGGPGAGQDGGMKVEKEGREKGGHDVKAAGAVWRRAQRCSAGAGVGVFVELPCLLQVPRLVGCLSPVLDAWPGFPSTLELGSSPAPAGVGLACLACYWWARGSGKNKQGTGVARHLHPLQRIHCTLQVRPPSGSLRSGLSVHGADYQRSRPPLTGRHLYRYLYLSTYLPTYLPPLPPMPLFLSTTYSPTCLIESLTSHL